MPLAPAPVYPGPQYLTIFGHSYWELTFGTRTQQGRADGYLRRLMNVEQGTEVQNHAQPGQRLCINGDWGWARIFQVVKGFTTATAGYLADSAPYNVGGWGGSGGAYLLGFGINDMGFNGQTALWNQVYANSMLAAISRLRMANLGYCGNNNYPNGVGGFAMSGWGYTAETSDKCTGSGLLYTTGSGNTITLTLPSDYNGEAIGLCFVVQPGGNGTDAVTFSGTAGVTGTLTFPAVPAVSLSWSPLLKRVTGLTAANAGQTIIITSTTVDAYTYLYFDSWWLEADTAPPVVVCNTARCCTNSTLGLNGYTAYQSTFTASGLSGTAVSSTPSTVSITSANFTFGLSSAGSMTIPSAGGTVTLSWTGTTITVGGTTTAGTLTGVTVSGGSGNYSSNTLTWNGPTAADVAIFNTYLSPVTSQFDSMVQIADMDTALGFGNAALFAYDGLHPNEAGASRVAASVTAAFSRLQATSPWGPAVNINPPCPTLAPLHRPYLSGQWYTSDTFGGNGTGTVYTAVAGDVWALPFFVTSGVSIWTQWSMQQLNTPTAAPTIFAAIFDDRQNAGYPQWMVVQMANSTALPLLTAAGTFNSTTTSGNNGYLTQAMDPGLYWFVVKIVTNGGATAATFATVHGPSFWVPNLTTAGASPGTGVFPCAWKLTGQGAGAMAGRFTTGAVAADNAPLIGVKTLLAQ